LRPDTRSNYLCPSVIVRKQYLYVSSRTQIDSNKPESSDGLQSVTDLTLVLIEGLKYIYTKHINQN